MNERHDRTDLTIIERLKQEQPGKNLVHAALSTLTEPEEIKKFTFEYAYELTISENKEIRSKPYAAALRDIGYSMHQYGGEVVARWKGAVEYLDHPFVNGTAIL